MTAGRWRCRARWRPAERLGVVGHNRVLCELLHECCHIDWLWPRGELEPAMQVHVPPGSQCDPFECLRAEGMEQRKVDLVGAMGICGMHLGPERRGVVEEQIEHVVALVLVGADDTGFT